MAATTPAFMIKSNRQPTSTGKAPKPWIVGPIVFVASGAFFALPTSWVGVGLGVVLVTAMLALAVRWSQAKGWSASHRLALAGGALLTYAWGGLVLSLQGPQPADGVTLVGNVVLSSGAIALLVVASRTVDRALSAKRSNA